MSKSMPPQVKDKSKRTKVFDYAIPLDVGSAAGEDPRARCSGSRDGGGAPVGAFAGARRR